MVAGAVLATHVRKADQWLDLVHMHNFNYIALCRDRIDIYLVAYWLDSGLNHELGHLESTEVGQAYVGNFLGVYQAL